MSDAKLTVACMRYDHTAALLDGGVEIPEAAVTFHEADIASDIFEPTIRDHAFDVAELGLTYYLRLVEQGDWPYVALPIFLARTFRHAAIYINTAGGIHTPEDLAGKTIGEFGMYGHDAGIWAKGVLADDYSVAADQCRWVIGGTDHHMAPFDFIEQRHPADVEVRPTPPGDTLSAMLVRGEIDALISARTPQRLTDRPATVTRLFSDYEAVEREYHRRTGIFPIMHVLVIRKDVVADRPELAHSVYETFCAAKNMAMARLRIGLGEQNIKSMVPWLTPLLEKNVVAFPDDWWPYGIHANRAVIETFTRYFAQQGLSSRLVRCEDLFAGEFLDT